MKITRKIKNIWSALMAEEPPTKKVKEEAKPQPTEQPVTIDMIRKGHFDDDKVPRYPPFAEGIPFKSLEQVIATQKDWISRIQLSIGFPDEDFNRWVMPVIHSYAAFVHLLPASQMHHHRGAGGLFRHGLEVGFFATQASEAVIFTMEGTPRQRRLNEPVWRLATFYAGLLHDVGKPLSDLSVTDKEGTQRWNPYAESLADWAVSKGITQYYLHWRHSENRHKRHEQFSVLNVERMIGKERLDYLAESGPKILQAMLEAISGAETTQQIAKLMKQGDQMSVKRDMEASRLEVDQFSYGVPIEAYLFNAMKTLLNEKTWKVNEPGAKVWVLEQGAFIVWEKAVPDIMEVIKKNQVPGVPSNAETLADILIERGLAVANCLENEVQYKFWKINPKIKVNEQEVEFKFLALHLESPELIFPDVVPKAVDGAVEMLEDKSKSDTDTENTTQSNTNIEPNSQSQTDIEIKDECQSVTEKPKTPEELLRSLGLEDDNCPEEQSSTPSDDLNTIPLESYHSDLEIQQELEVLDDPNCFENQNLINEQECAHERIEQTVVPKITEQEKAPIEECAHERTATGNIIATLEEKFVDPKEHDLIHIVSAALQSDAIKKRFKMHNRHLLLIDPDAFDGLTEPKNEIIQRLFQSGLAVINPAHPLPTPSEHNGIVSVALNEEVTAILKDILSKQGIHLGRSKRQREKPVNQNAIAQAFIDSLKKGVPPYPEFITSEIAEGFWLKDDCLNDILSKHPRVNKVALKAVLRMNHGIKNENNCLFIERDYVN